MSDPTSRFDPQHPQTTPADRHVPVLRDRIVDLLAPALTGDLPLPGGAVPLYVDATLGMGGHAEAILTACPQAHLLGIDRDPQARALAAERLAPFGDRVAVVAGVYDEIADLVAEYRADRGEPGAAGAQGILFDLGVSSLQLDEADRGFAYRIDAPLDMRMNPDEGITAADLLNEAEVGELTRILRDYGEERFAGRIARAIVAEREVRPFTTSGPLVDLLRRVIPAASQRSSGHPAKRTFQALRIEVNQELSVWERALPAALETLSLSGRVAVLSYHSLEDRIAKKELATGARSTAPPGLPVELAEHAPWLRLLTRGAEEASEAEKAENPRASSVRLRAAERIGPGPGARGGKASRATGRRGGSGRATGRTGRVDTVRRGRR